MISTLNIEAAGKNDVIQLVSLINSAYRGEGSKQGWTTEADLLDGIRTDEASILSMIDKPGSVILKCSNEKNELLACVYLQELDDQLYLGMLTVSPLLQGAGIGKELLRAAEEYAKQQQLNAIIMNVISVRSELIAWYERHGYKRTGETKAFPSSDPRFGIPRQKLEFVILRKSLTFL